MLQLEMEKLSLKKAAEGSDRGARQRLAALESQLEGECGGWGRRVEGLLFLRGGAAGAVLCRSSTAPGAVSQPASIFLSKASARSAHAFGPPGSRARLALTHARLRPRPPRRQAALVKQQKELQAMWEAERDEMGRVQQLKGEIDRVNIEIQVRRSRPPATAGAGLPRSLCRCGAAGAQMADRASQLGPTRHCGATRVASPAARRPAGAALWPPSPRPCAGTAVVGRTSAWPFPPLLRCYWSCTQPAAPLVNIPAPPRVHACAHTHTAGGGARL